MVKVLYVIEIAAVFVLDESFAMRKIEHAQRLADNLINHIVVATILPCPVKRADGGDGGSRHVHALVISAKRDQFVALEREVHVDVQFHVLLAYWLHRQPQLKSSV